jgi:hypothetical protein
MASGEMSEVTFTQFLETVFRSLARHSGDGSIHLSSWTGAIAMRC